jgi:hypothetical protein
MFLLDRSSSMSTAMGSSIRGADRWAALGSALARVLPPVDSTIAIGALAFPATSLFDSCALPGRADLLPATGNVGALTRLMNNSSPEGGTPTAGALDMASRLLLGLRTANMARALVLATDGGPDCNSNLSPFSCRCIDSASFLMCSSAEECLDAARTVREIADLESRGLPTYVIGIESDGDREFDDVLSAMAMAGGRPYTGGTTSFYRATSPADLDAALTAIRDQVGFCTYLTTSVPDQLGSIVVTVNGTELSPDQWAWGDKYNGELLLLGQICQTLAAEANPVLTATVVCGED